MVVKKQTRGAVIKNPEKQQPRDWKRLLMQMWVLTILVLIIGGIGYLREANILPIKHVTVKGEIRHVDRDQLVKAVTPFVRGSFLNVDVASIRTAGEGLPWVRQIQVRRIWPDTLHLVVEEHKAVARWNQDGLVHTLGGVFHPATETIPKGLVQMYGPEGTSQLMMRRLVEIQQQVKTLGLQVKTISMDKRRAWQLEFKDGLHLKLGRADGDTRLQRFIDVYRSGLNSFREQIKEIDLRYTNGLAVVWKDGQQPDFNGTV